MALWGYTVARRVGVVHQVLCNHQIADYAALEYTVNFVSSLGKDRVGLVVTTIRCCKALRQGKQASG